tara:strand:+ start:2183 stop:2884 length:702 start_codon:yes stop_codon:yes gene_type:complete
MDSPVEQLQTRISYRFRDPTLLDLALTHPSWLQDHPDGLDSNQRLEFLGDAVLQLALTEHLFELYPQGREGDLSKRRAALSNGTYLAKIAKEIELGDALKLSQSEQDTGGREKSSALEDAFEALLGAIISDSDFEKAKSVILHLFGDLPKRLDEVIPEENPKGRLQEKVQPGLGNEALRYAVQHIAGDDHAREYEAQVFLQDRLIGTGRGSSKKAAEEEAARDALDSPDLLLT